MNGVQGGSYQDRDDQPDRAASANARRRWQVGHHYRAPRGGHGARRPDHRPRPGAGHDDGQIMFEGTPADLVAARSTLSGKHLAAYVGT
jgi:hypothetical protein